MAHPIPPFSTLARFKRVAKQLLKTYLKNPSICEERIAASVRMILAGISGSLMHSESWPESVALAVGLSSSNSWRRPPGEDHF